MAVGDSGRWGEQSGGRGQPADTAGDEQVAPV